MLTDPPSTLVPTSTGPHVLGEALSAPKQGIQWDGFSKSSLFSQISLSQL